MGWKKLNIFFYTLLNASTIQGWLIEMMLSLKMCYLGSLLSSLCSLLQRVPGPFAERPPTSPSLLSVCLSLSLSLSNKGKMPEIDLNVSFDSERRAVKTL